MLFGETTFLWGNLIFLWGYTHSSLKTHLFVRNSSPLTEYIFLWNNGMFVWGNASLCGRTSPCWWETYFSVGLPNISVGENHLPVGTHNIPVGKKAHFLGGNRSSSRKTHISWWERHLSVRNLSPLVKHILLWGNCVFLLKNICSCCRKTLSYGENTTSFE